MKAPFYTTLKCSLCASQWVVDVSSLGREALNSCTAAGLLQRLTNDLHKDDILIRLNCIEMLTKMAVGVDGLQYLERQGVVGALESMMESVDNDPMMHFLLPGDVSSSNK